MLLGLADVRACCTCAGKCVVQFVFVKCPSICSTQDDYCVLTVWPGCLVGSRLVVCV